LTTQTEVFDAHVRESRDWVTDVMTATGLDEADALAALRAVMQGIRDEMTVRQSGHFVSEMPATIRGFFFEGWDPSRPPRIDRSPQHFVNRICACFAGRSDAACAQVVRGVFGVLERRIPDAAARVKRNLPNELRGLWPERTADHVLDRKERLGGEERLAAGEALHAHAGHERGAALASHQNRPPGEQHRGGPLPNTM
jgi:uncharacterized protein (DUF2267 family)